jgi:hypothetical protein
MGARPRAELGWKNRDRRPIQFGVWGARTQVEPRKRNEAVSRALIGKVQTISLQKKYIITL